MLRLIAGPSNVLSAALRGLVLALMFLAAHPAVAQIAVRGEMVYTMAGEPIHNGVVVVEDGVISAVGPAAAIDIPQGMRIMEAAVVTPGLIDARSTVGVSGILNIPHDQDQLERSGPLHPELRAIDAYNPQERLVEWVRSFGITTVHTGHAPGELIAGQTMVVKTHGRTVDDAIVREPAALAATIGPMARRQDSPGTRGKIVAMMRGELIRAQEYMDRRRAAEQDGENGIDEPDEEGREPRRSPPPRDLGLETLGGVLDGELPLIITAHRAQDIVSALRLAEEFGFRLILDGAAESYLLIDEIRDAGVPVMLHPTMARAHREMENMSFTTAARLRIEGIPVAIQSGYESYVPKTRIVLFEAAIAARHGMVFEHALEMITRTPAVMLGIDDRVGSIEVGKDGDLALYNGDPFEYTTHCIGVIINGQVVSDEPR